MNDLDWDRNESEAAAEQTDCRAVHLEPLALRATEAARALGIGERQLWSLTKSGQIPHVRVGRTITYPIALLRDWLRKRAKGGK